MQVHVVTTPAELALWLRLHRNLCGGTSDARARKSVSRRCALARILIHADALPA